MPKKRITAQETIDAIRGSGGFVTQVAKRLGVSRTTVYNLLKDYKSAQEALEDEREQQKDFAEGKLLEGIRAGNPTLIIFYLKTQAKDRGYIEKMQQEITGADGGPIKHKFEGLEDLSDEELDDVIASANGKDHPRPKSRAK